MTDQPRRGEVWWCELAEVGRRPVVVLSRGAAIRDTFARLSRRARRPFADS